MLVTLSGTVTFREMRTQEKLLLTDAGQIAGDRDVCQA